MGNRVFDAKLLQLLFGISKKTCNLQQLSTLLMGFLQFSRSCGDIGPKEGKNNCRGFFATTGTFSLNISFTFKSNSKSLLVTFSE